MPYSVRGCVLVGFGSMVLASGAAGACSSHGGALPGAGGDSGAEISCQLQKDCPDDLLCDSTLGVCVQCLDEGDCESGQSCLAGVCRMGCQSDKDCRDLDQLCGDADLCVDCVSDRHCQAGETCSEAGVCLSDSGEGGASSGGSGGSNGGSAGTPPVGGGGAGMLPTAGAPGEAGMPGVGEAGAGNIPSDCVTTPIDPCASLPHYTGTQTVDGDDADFCSVPPFTLAMNSAVYYRGTQPPVSSTTSATARVAWSAAALHVFVKVTDGTPYPNSSTLTYIWNGDNIEFFASPQTPLGQFNATRSYEGGAFQVIAAAPGGLFPSTGQAAFTSTGVAYAVPAAQFKSTLVAGGYTIEAQIPWTQVAPTAGSPMGFDFGLSDDIDGAYSGVTGDYRDYYALLYNAALVGGYCSAHYEPYCDSRNWCTPIAAP